MFTFNKKENDELNEILENNQSFCQNENFSVEPPAEVRLRRETSRVVIAADDDGGMILKHCQWSTNGKIFVPTSKTVPFLKPGVYEIKSDERIGLYFERIETKIEGLLRFPDSNSLKVIEEIQRFWTLENIFENFNLAYKRGILLWGPPGGGKTCTVHILVHDIINKYNGIVFNFTNPELTKEGIRRFREIQPKTPFIMMMEDIDAIIHRYNESDVLNLLDGVERFNKCVFIATTNYPERLGARIINRPSRFDKRFKIDFPNSESRTMYLKSLIPDKLAKEHNIDLEKWVNDTDKFSVAHLKELFIAVIILGDNYEEAITTLRSMKDIPTSTNDGRKMGFGFNNVHNAKDNCNGSG